MSVMRGEWRVVALVLLVATVILNFMYPGERLIHHQVELQKGIGHAAVNHALYQYHEKYGFKGKIGYALPTFWISTWIRAVL